MANEITKKEATDLTVPQGSWGGEGVDTRDIMLPKILLMQGLSDAVNEGEAQMGDMINSITKDKLGDKNSEIEFIPVATFKTWVVSHKAPGKNKFEFHAVVPMDSTNKDRDPFEEVTLEDGTIERWDNTINFYVLLPSELPAGDALPYVLSFRRTSYKAGKKVINHFTKMNMLQQPPAAKTLKLLCKGEKNDQGSYFVFDIEAGRVSTQEELAEAFKWYSQISKGNTKVDNSDLEKGDVATTSDSAQF